MVAIHALVENTWVRGEYMWARGDDQPIKNIREQFVMESFVILSIFDFQNVSKF